MNLTGEAKTLITIGIVTVLILVSAVFFLSESPTTNDLTSVTSDPIDQTSLIKEDSYKISSKDAKVTIVEFLDYECEACGASHPVIKQVLEQYQGKVNFVVRNFPNHFNSILAANAVEAAGEQGKYWEMHDKLFESQSEWGEKRQLQTALFIKYATELGLDTIKFKDSIESGKFTEKITRDKNEGLALGVDATPTFYINGVKNVGGLSLSEWKKKIDAELSK